MQKLVEVSVGETLDGVITLTSSSGTSFNYVSNPPFRLGFAGPKTYFISQVSSYSNIAGTSLTVTGAEQLVWATETLEVYGVETITDFPAGSTVFSGIKIVLENGATPTETWSSVSDTADGIDTTINTNSASAGVITIKF